MSPEEIDRAIDALPGVERAELFVAAIQNWRFRAQNVAIFFAILGGTFSLFLAMRMLVKSQWPGSLVAATFATFLLVAIFFGLLRLSSSKRVMRWRFRWAERREYKYRSGAA